MYISLSFSLQSSNYPTVMPVWFSDSDSSIIPNLVEQLNDASDSLLSSASHPVSSWEGKGRKGNPPIQKLPHLYKTSVPCTDDVIIDKI